MYGIRICNHYFLNSYSIIKVIQTFDLNTSKSCLQTSESLLITRNQSYNYLILQHISVARKREQPNGEVQGEVEEGTTSSKAAGAGGVVPQRRHH